MKNNDEREISVDYMARVEGEGAFHVKIKNKKVTEVQLKIFEPPRFFEAFLQGRRANEAPDITARICGICPVAYQMSSTHAIEKIYGIKITPEIRELRRLLYCGEWIESHALHVYMLHAPDFLGFEDAIQIAKIHPEIVKKGLELKKVGNNLVDIVGGRAIHPINVRVGGFYRAPVKKDLDNLKERLKRACDIAVEMVQWTSTFNFPNLEKDYLYVSLRHNDEYPFNEGNVVSSEGLNIDQMDYENYFKEKHLPYSTTLHSTINGKIFHVGPLARYNLNFDRLPSDIQDLAKKSVGEKCSNPFKSIIVRSIETLYACREALRIIENYSEPEQSFVEAPPKAGIAVGISEAPRGILMHRYETDDEGYIKKANIVAPTSANQSIIEEDLMHFVEKNQDLSDAELTWKCEQSVRNYDPCISCSTHFLKLDIKRE